jgi:hypothetical protein
MCVFVVVADGCASAAVPMTGSMGEPLAPDVPDSGPSQPHGELYLMVFHLLTVFCLRVDNVVVFVCSNSMTQDG